MYGPDVAILLMYGSHDMRHTGFRRLTVVNGLPGFGASHFKIMNIVNTNGINQLNVSYI